MGVAEDLKQFTSSELDRKRARVSKAGNSYTSEITYTGRLKDSLDIIDSSTGNKIDIVLQGLEYGNYLNEGTGGGHFPPLDQMISWVDRKIAVLKDQKGNSMPKTAKNLRSVAFVISRSIALRGISPTNYLTDIVNDKFDSIIESLTPEVAMDIEENIESILLELGYTKKGDDYVLETSN